MSKLNSSYLKEAFNKRKPKFQAGTEYDPVPMSEVQITAKKPKRFKSDFRSKSQIANQMGMQRDQGYVRTKTPAEQKAIKEKESEELRRRINGTIRQTTDADREWAKEYENRKNLTFAGRAGARGASSPLNDLLDAVNPFSYYYAGKDIGRGLGQTAQGIANLDSRQIGAGLTQAGLNALAVLPAVSEAKPLLKTTGKYLTTQTPLRNAYKLNPWAFKANPEAYYRGIGEAGLDDAIKSGVLRTNRNPSWTSSPGDSPYFFSGKNFEGIKEYEPNVIAEVVNQPMRARTFSKFVGSGDQSVFQPIRYTGQKFAGKDVVEKLPNIPLGENVKLYKQDWLRGYKEVPKPKQSFKSEIDWAKWNSEIPKNAALMKEYNTIEQTTKANGTWMKNPDGSAFQGTPEQFIQQNSQNFKKAFPEFQTTFRGKRDFDPAPQDKILFTTDDKQLAAKYGSQGQTDLPATEFYHPDKNTLGYNDQGGLYEFYHRPSRLKIDAKGSEWYNIENAPYRKIMEKTIPEQVKNWDYWRSSNQGLDKGNYLSTDEFASYIKNNKIPSFEINNVFDGSNVSSTVKGFNTNVLPIKSRWYNNGMFDMTNPNIYKGLIPAGLGLGAAQQYLQNKPKGTYQMGGMSIPGVNGSVVSSYQSTQYKKYKSKKK